jgi:hypothetical protein
MPRRALQILVATLAAAAAVALFRRRPIEPPADEGTWEPV